MHTSLIGCWIYHVPMQSSTYFICLLCYLLRIVLYCSLLFYIPLPWYYALHFVFTQLATCHFTSVICLLNYKAWPRRFAWFIINQCKFAILCYGWCISTYKLSMTLPLSIHIHIFLQFAIVQWKFAIMNHPYRLLDCA